MIILLGVAGSGKSLQSRMLADEYGFAWISTGEILRVLITGKRRQEMLAGKLLSDEEMIQVMDKVLDLIDTKQEFVLDGFPRTIKQTDWLMAQVKKSRFGLTAILHMSADEKVVHGRLKQRGRQDDNEEAITKRFEEYRAVTVPILEHFKREKIRVYNVDAAAKPRQVHDAIMEIVRKNSIG
ncbi:MAG TPA: nucleoside monophosphate kinase [Candidatus Saccharimonadales bacterium]|nr:nucleoside monophosphate kinase [Candidatus Saccharimonadales bacterium]